MPVRIAANAEASDIAATWRREVLEPAVTALAGKDGRLSRTEAARLSKLTGTAALAGNNLSDVFERAARPSSRSVSVRAFLEAGEVYARAAVTTAAGADGRLQRSEFAALGALAGDFELGAREVGVVSDLDSTVIPPETKAGQPRAYPGVAALYRELEGAQQGDVTFVTARSPDRVTDVPAYLEENGVPLGPIETGIGSQPWVAKAEKVRDIAKVIEANPDQTFVLFGDTAHVDPEVYREIRARYPERIAAAFIHQVTKPGKPSRLEGLTPISNYAEAAASLYRSGVLDRAAAQRVIAAARAEGLALTDAQVKALLD